MAAGESTRPPAGRRRVPAWLLTAALGAVYVALAPPSADLAAQAYRAGLFERAGYVAWDNGWFAGHATLPYSLLSPPLMAWLGVHLTGALSAGGAGAAFERLVAGGGRGGRIGALAFAAAVGAHLWTGRVTFLLGLALGLAAVLAAVAGAGLGWAVVREGLGARGALNPPAGPLVRLATGGPLALLAGVGVPAVALLALYPAGDPALRGLGVLARAGGGGRGRAARAAPGSSAARERWSTRCCWWRPSQCPTRWAATRHGWARWWRGRLSWQRRGITAGWAVALLAPAFRLLGAVPRDPRLVARCGRPSGGGGLPRAARRLPACAGRR